MILAVDMGNTNIKIGLVGDGDPVIEERINTCLNSTSFEYAGHIMHLLEYYEVEKTAITGAVVSSVVPPLTGVICTAVQKALGFRPLEVSTGLRTEVKFLSPVGADIMVAAEAAWCRYREPCIIVNMGTATTMTVVDKDGVFRGGVILPGMKTSLNALTQGAAKLPAISLCQPGSTMSYNTEDCMRSGIVYGNAAQIDQITRRMEGELGYSCRIIATGGMARFCVPYAEREIISNDSLLMEGLLRIYEENTAE